MIDGSENKKNPVMVFKEIVSIFVIPTVSKETGFISKDPEPRKVTEFSKERSVFAVLSPLVIIRITTNTDNFASRSG